MDTHTGKDYLPKAKGGYELKRLALTTLVAGLLVLGLIPAFGAPNLYGTSGLMEIADDSIQPVKSISVGYHGISNGGTVNFYSLGVGIAPNLEISACVLSYGGTETTLNAKYLVTPETATRPSVTVGVVDALEKWSDDPGLYVLLGKNLTSAAEEIAGRPSKPLRGYLGFGMGAAKGLLVGLDWSLAPKISAMAEFRTEWESHGNIGIRYAATDEINIDLGLYDFKDFTFGASYTAIRF